MNLVESLFHYSISAIREHDQESNMLAKEYKKGSLDPTKIVNSRFEKQQQLRKRIEMMQKRKRDPMI